MSNQKRNIMYIALLIVGVVLYAAGSLGHVAESQMCFYAVCGMEVIYLSCRAVVNRKY